MIVTTLATSAMLPSVRSLVIEQCPNDPRATRGMPGAARAAAPRGPVDLDLGFVKGGAALEPDVCATFLRAVASRHDARAARMAEAGVCVHADEFGAVAATRSLPES